MFDECSMFVYSCKEAGPGGPNNRAEPIKIKPIELVVKGIAFSLSCM